MRIIELKDSENVRDYWTRPCAESFASITEILDTMTPKAYKHEVYRSKTAGTLSCFSRKRQTLGCDSYIYEIRGSLVILETYKDATNTRGRKYFKIGLQTR